MHATRLLASQATMEDQTKRFSGATIVCSRIDFGRQDFLCCSAGDEDGAATLQMQLHLAEIHLLGFLDFYVLGFVVVEKHNLKK